MFLFRRRRLKSFGLLTGPVDRIQSLPIKRDRNWNPLRWFAGADDPGAVEVALEPEGTELVKKGDRFRWIEKGIVPFRREYGERVGSLVPGGFEAYARVFHPAYLHPDREDLVEPVRWSRVASMTGRTVHPEMEFRRIANLEPNQGPSLIGEPDDGYLPEKECGIVAGVLRGFTSTPDRCYFGVWEGYGYIDSDLYKDAYRLKISSDRPHLFFRGPLDVVILRWKWKSVVGEHEGGMEHAPNFWWPEDQAWYVATDIDGFDTYIGGSQACIEAILGHPDLEALPTTYDASWHDTINT